MILKKCFTQLSILTLLIDERRGKEREAVRTDSSDCRKYDRCEEREEEGS
jgi:hypothetical protein